jgi:hypothetical protein
LLATKAPPRTADVSNEQIQKLTFFLLDKYFVFFNPLKLFVFFFALFVWGSAALLLSASGPVVAGSFVVGLLVGWRLLACGLPDAFPPLAPLSLLRFLPPCSVSLAQAVSQFVSISLELSIAQPQYHSYSRFHLQSSRRH